MHYIIDPTANRFILEHEGLAKEMRLDSHEAIATITTLAAQLHHDGDYARTHSWDGMPVKQFAEDFVRLQEVLWWVKPDVIVQTGFSLGGLTLFFASMCELVGHGKVIAIGDPISRDLRRAVEGRYLGRHVNLIQGESTAPETIDAAKQLIGPNDRVFVFLGSGEDKPEPAEAADPVAQDLRARRLSAELEAYSPLVSVESYLLTPSGAKDFAITHRDFVLARPKAAFHEDRVLQGFSYWQDAWLKRVS